MADLTKMDEEKKKKKAKKEVRYNVQQCVAMCYRRNAEEDEVGQRRKCVAVWCSASQFGAVRYSLVQCVTVCCRQANRKIDPRRRCGAVCCNALQCVAD